MKQQSRKYYNIAFQLLLLKTENSTSTHFLGMLDSDEEKKKDFLATYIHVTLWL